MSCLQAIALKTHVSASVIAFPHLGSFSLCRIFFAPCTNICCTKGGNMRRHFTQLGTQANTLGFHFWEEPADSDSSTHCLGLYPVHPFSMKQLQQSPDKFNPSFGGVGSCFFICVCLKRNCLQDRQIFLF